MFFRLPRKRTSSDTTGTSALCPQADVALAPFEAFHSTENRRRVAPELPSGTCRTPLFQRQRSCRSAGKNSEINRNRDCGYRFIRDASFVRISTLREEHHESTDHNDADGHGAPVLGGFFAGW